MRYLSIGAMFRNENSWLEEWIKYHRALGVEYFYLFNHDDDTRVSDKILQPYWVATLSVNTVPTWDDS